MNTVFNPNQQWLSKTKGFGLEFPEGYQYYSKLDMVDLFRNDGCTWLRFDNLKKGRSGFARNIWSTLELVGTTKECIMNVKIKIELSSPPDKKDREEMYDAAEFLTNKIDSIYIYQPRNQKNELIAEFTIDKARQIDVVDRIGKEFTYNVENYSQSSISFPNKPTRKFVKTKPKYTPKQGQYLSFIYYFTKLNGMAPAEVDFQKYFKTSPPTIHNMIVKLEEKGLIKRKPKTSRSIKLLLFRSELPDLE